jgi:hypothetical protein
VTQNINTYGTKNVVYSATANNLTGTATRTVNIWSVPVITISGGNTLNLENGDTAAAPNATATQNGASIGGITNNWSIVDTSKEGTYSVVYMVTGHGVEGTQTLTVKVWGNPIISFTASNPFDMTQGDKTTPDPGATATQNGQPIEWSSDWISKRDAYSGTITPFEVVYTASGALGMTTQKTLVVNVWGVPVCTINPPNTLSINAGESVSDPGAIATQNGGPMTSGVSSNWDGVMTSGINTPGSYVISYSATGHGLTSPEVQRTVNVYPLCDANRDGTVNGQDYYIWDSRYG